MRFAPVRLVAEHLALLAVQQRGICVISLTFAAVVLRLCTMPRRSVPMCAFMPKCQSLPFFV